MSRPRHGEARVTRAPARTCSPPASVLRCRVRAWVTNNLRHEARPRGTTPWRSGAQWRRPLGHRRQAEPCPGASRGTIPTGIRHRQPVHPAAGHRTSVPIVTGHRRRVVGAGPGPLHRLGPLRAESAQLAVAGAPGRHGRAVPHLDYLRRGGTRSWSNEEHLVHLPVRATRTTGRLNDTGTDCIRAGRCESSDTTSSPGARPPGVTPEKMITCHVHRVHATQRMICTARWRAVHVGDRCRRN